MSQNTSHSNSFKEEKPCLLPIRSNGSDAKKVNFSSNQGWTSQIFLNIFTSYQTYKQINLIVTGCVSLCEALHTAERFFTVDLREVQKGSLNISVEEKLKTLLSFIIEPHSPTFIQIYDERFGENHQQIYRLSVKSISSVIVTAFTWHISNASEFSTLHRLEKDHIIGNDVWNRLYAEVFRKTLLKLLAEMF